jgi:hypothetical protein
MLMALIMPSASIDPNVTAGVCRCIPGLRRSHDSKMISAIHVMHLDNTRLTTRRVLPCVRFLIRFAGSPVDGVAEPLDRFQFVWVE